MVASTGTLNCNFEVIETTRLSVVPMSYSQIKEKYGETPFLLSCRGIDNKYDTVVIRLKLEEIRYVMRKVIETNLSLPEELTDLSSYYQYSMITNRNDAVPYCEKALSQNINEEDMTELTFLLVTYYCARNLFFNEKLYYVAEYA